MLANSRSLWVHVYGTVLFSYQLKRVKVIAWFLWNILNQPTAPFWTAAHAVSQDGNKNVEDCATCPSLHDWQAMIGYCHWAAWGRVYVMPPTQKALVTFFLILSDKDGCCIIRILRISKGQNFSFTPFTNRMLLFCYVHCIPNNKISCFLHNLLLGTALQVFNTLNKISEYPWAWMGTCTFQTW